MTDIGTVLGGRYRLVELLGQGGMATIYRARDNQLQRDVAVKVLRPEYGADPDFNERFRHEAQSAASLNHPSVVAVYDYGTDPVGPFIVMELVEGEDLAAIVRRGGALPPRAAARIVAQAARAVSAAHDRGFVHRDIKPGNILVTHDGRVKVADFGIARALSESALTLPGTTLGSVHYFSPEQARGELATPASDIYSLGIVLFELLTGRRPWSGDTAAAIATARLTGAVPSPSAVRPGIPPTLEAVTRKALAPRAEDRYASASDMAEALEQVAGEDRGDGARRRAAGAAGAVAGAGAGGAAAGAGAGTVAAGAAGGAAAGALGGAAAGAGAAGLAGTGGAGVGAGAGAGAAPGSTGATPTIAAGVARPNPDARIDYPLDAYAAGRVGPAGRRVGTNVVEEDEVEEPEEERRGGGPWLWVSALLAVAILGLAAFLLLGILGNPGASAAPQVAVPNLVGKTFDQARLEATAVGLTVEQAGFEQSDTAAPGTVLRQEPAADALVDRGSAIQLTVAIGRELTIVPDLRLRTEAEAVNLIADAGLDIGTRTEAFDLIVPAGSVVSQAPAAGQSVVPDTPVDYVVSRGPEPTPSPTPTPAPTPTPEPTPTPPPPPTPTPTPAELEVEDYRCVLLIIAQDAIDNDGFEVGSITGPNDPAAMVIWQDPQPGDSVPPGTEIDLWTAEQPAATCPAEPS